MGFCNWVKLQFKIELDYKSGFGQKVTFNNLIFLKIMAGDLGTEPKEQDIKFIQVMDYHISQVIRHLKLIYQNHRNMDII